MNKSNLLHKIIVSTLTILVSIGIFACGAYVESLGFSFRLTTDIMLIVLCIYLSFSVCLLIRQKPLKTPRIRLKKLFDLCAASVIFIYLFLAAAIFFAGTGFSKPYSGPVQKLFLVFSVYSLCRLTYAASIRLEPSTDSAMLDSNQYPELYSIAKRAAEAIGYKTDELLINVISGITVSGIEIDGVTRLLIGTQLVSLVNEYELEALMTAELGLLRAGSVSCDSQIKKKFTHWHIAISDGPKELPNFLIAIQYRLLEAKLTSELEAAVVIDDSARAQAIVCFGIPSDYVNAIAKMTLFGLYFKTPRRIHYFDNPEPPRDIEEQIYADYKRFRDNNASRLDIAIKNTTFAGNNQPLTALLSQLSFEGQYDLFTEPISSGYICEAENLRRLTSGIFADSISDSYTEQREKVYFPAMDCINSYENKLAAGEKPELYDSLRAAEAYMDIGSPDKAEAVYDSILAEDQTNGRVCYEKGMILIGQLNDEAISFFERAIGKDSFLAGKIYETLSGYYNIIGDVSNSSLYCEKAKSFEVSDNAARNRVFDITSEAQLSPILLPPDVLNEVSDKLRLIARDSASEIVISARELDDEGYNLVFVKLKPELSDEDRTDVLHAIYLYLDSREEPFYLTEYNNCKDVFEIAQTSEKSLRIDL